MTNAPERIWANVAVWGNGEPLAGEWNHRDVGLTDDTLFIRADLAPDPALFAEVVEALRITLRFIENTESELGIKMDSGDRARAVLAKIGGAK